MSTAREKPYGGETVTLCWRGQLVLAAHHRAVLHGDAIGTSTGGGMSEATCPWIHWLFSPREWGETGATGKKTKPIALRSEWEPHSKPMALLLVAASARAHTHYRSTASRLTQYLGFSPYMIFCFGTVQLSCKMYVSCVTQLLKDPSCRNTCKIMVSTEMLAFG